uniref:Uncharacterized protein n=1 Tax=Cacopsylla melanoneura TaxID=428564 RepID=A0A8D8TJB5_9HEMI
MPSFSSLTFWFSWFSLRRDPNLSKKLPSISCTSGVTFLPLLCLILLQGCIVADKARLKRGFRWRLQPAFHPDTFEQDGGLLHATTVSVDTFDFQPGTGETGGDLIAIVEVSFCHILSIYCTSAAGHLILDL